MFDMIWEMALKEFIRSSLVDLLTNISNDITRAKELIALSPQTAFGETFWSNITKVSNSSVMPLCYLLIGLFLAIHIYNEYCKTNGRLEIETVSRLTIKCILVIFISTNGLMIVEGIFNLFTDMAVGIADGFNYAIENDITGNVDNIMETLGTLNLGKVIEIGIGSMIVGLMDIFIFIIVYIRLAEITVYWFFAPIPLATFISDEYKDIGKNFVKKFSAIILQGGIMLLCIGIYAALVIGGQFLPSAENGYNIFSMLGLGIVLIMLLIKSGSMARSIIQSV